MPIFGGNAGGGAAQLVQRITTAASQVTVDFQNISAIYQDLEFRYVARSNVASTTENLYIKFNNDATSGNYTSTSFQLENTGGNVGATTSGAVLNSIAGASDTAGYASQGIVTLLSYANGTFVKHWQHRGGYTASTSVQTTQMAIGAYSALTPITRVTFVVPTSYLNGSIFSMYGIGVA